MCLLSSTAWMIHTLPERFSRESHLYNGKTKWSYLTSFNILALYLLTEVMWSTIIFEVSPSNVFNIIPIQSLDLTSSLWGKSGGKVKSHCKETIREIQNKGYSTKLWPVLSKSISQNKQQSLGSCSCLPCLAKYCESSLIEYWFKNASKIYQCNWAQGNFNLDCLLNLDINRRLLLIFWGVIMVLYAYVRKYPYS